MHAALEPLGAHSATPRESWLNVLRGLGAALKTHAGRACAAMLLLIAAKAAAVVVPLIFKQIVDRLSRLQDGGIVQAGLFPVSLLIAYALVRFSSTLFTELRDLVFARVAQQTMRGYAEAAFAHLLNLSPRFHARRSTGAVIRDIERGTTGVGFLLGTGLFTIVPTLIELIGVVAIMSRGYGAPFTLVILATFAVYAVFTTAMTQRRSLRQRRVNVMDARANARLVDSLINYETVTAYARGEYERRRYADICNSWIERSVRNQHALSILHIGQGIIIALGVGGVMWLAGERTLMGTMTVGDLVLVNSYVIQVCLPLNALGFVFREARDAVVNAEALFALLAQNPEIVDSPDSKPLRITGPEVRFEHVSFSYESGRPILFDIDLTIGPGQKLAVVGGSGSGKSTLARLLLRFYDVQEGRVLIDGQDVRAVELASLRSAIGLVPQDTVLFNDTIAHNIGYGNPGAGMDAITAAATMAQLHELILTLPQQYKTVVGERGAKLSGGERQRLAIARAFLKNPPLMIFDEATSALDTRSERAVQRELDQVASGRTSLVIAHRLSTVVDADLIVVLDKGRIVERGRHEDLLADGGLYAQLWKLQLQQRDFDRMQRRYAQHDADLGELLLAVTHGLAEELSSNGVQLQIEMEGGGFPIRGDAASLSDVLSDACRQVASAATPQGRIRLALTHNAPMVCLEMRGSRNGHGTSTREDLGDTAADPLAMQSTLERHGGRLRVESIDELKGLRLRIELPMR